MPNFWYGVTVTLSANTSTSLRIRIPVDGVITQFLTNSTGRVAINNIEISGVADFFEGIMELAQFKEYGNVYHLPEPIAVTKGSDLVITLTDISGATNAVYFAIHIATR